MPSLTLSFLERSTCAVDVAFLYVAQTLVDCLHDFKPFPLQHVLIGARVLHHKFGLAVDGEHDRTPDLLHLFHEVRGVALKVRKRVNILAEV
jgi:hypothetical protein